MKPTTILLIILLGLNAISQTNTETKMKIIEVKDVETKQTPHNVDVRVLYDKESAQAVHIELKPGESLKPHITPVDVFFYVLEGTPSIMVGEETIEVKKDQLIESPKDIKHCIYNYSKETARILVIKAPKPTSSARIL
ncbi:MAG: cupin domain-containing protein [Bacteroidales bacterium]|nr:cupin domain-containing protein [Bacteroidales bacterium]